MRFPANPVPPPVKTPLMAGTHLAIKQPERAVDEVVRRMDAGSCELEL